MSMKNSTLIILLTAALILVSGCGQKSATRLRPPIAVEPGIEVLFKQHIDELRGETIGLVINHSAVDKKGVSIVDKFMAYDDITIQAIFAPEHGYRGDQMGRIENEVDPVSGARIYSLHGEIRKPTPAMLAGIDVLIFDMQSLGVKFYTYISTMGLAMQAAAENGVEYWVLDRPNPITGTRVDGSVQAANTGRYIIPVQYGLTMGELANMVVGEGWMEFPEGFKPRVIAMSGWERDRWYDETDIPWVPTSPNIPTLETAIVYPGMCFFEGVNVSEGRGTPHPFMWIGAPWVEGEELARTLNEMKVPGADFTPIEFVTKAIPGKSTRPRYEGEKSEGIQVNIVNRNELEPVKLGVYVMYALHELYPDTYEMTRGIDGLSGNTHLRAAIDEGQTPEEIFEHWQKPLEEFKEKRIEYLLYP
jgi:uncharacterized protein YbbC (DUF1343 family)